LTEAADRRRNLIDELNAVAVGYGPPVSFASPARSVRPGLRRDQPRPTRKMGEGQMGARLIRPTAVADKASRTRFANEIGRTFLQPHDRPARMTHDAARQGDRTKPHRMHAPRRSIAAEHLLFRRLSLCIILDLSFWRGIPAHGKVRVCP
jgi:hypothetical protein